MKYLTVEEAADVARRTPKAMRQLRARRLRGEPVGPNFRKVNGRVLVSDEDLDAWLITERQRCGALTLAGTPCPNFTMRHGALCERHQRLADRTLCPTCGAPWSPPE